ncbi:peptidoglycan D,D-transpeptidase FtsI family protein [Xylanivirga thermophila]|jgi:penicillin-binding protein A|uniref:peptidoglycan D,D-transpeptidase FtsI family protein n=1 Tax=Xylanivirga thermophila TaxID=2496273 RepID=UPI0039F4F8B8
MKGKKTGKWTQDNKMDHTSGNDDNVHLDKKLQSNIKNTFTVFIIMFAVLAGYFCYALFFYGDRWFSNAYNNRVRMDSEAPKIIPGDILDRQGMVLATTKNGSYKNSKTGEMQKGYYRQYNKDVKYSAHVVGFNNQSGRAGAEAFHIKYIMGYNNNIFERIYQKAFLPQERGNDVVLTIDWRLQKYISQAMGNQKGSVVVLDTNTGEILAMVSKPSFDPNDMSTVKNDALVERAVQGLYPPGSIFKVITEAAAIQNIEGISDRVFDCKGTIKIDDQEIPCYNKKVHGQLKIEDAISVSCNTTFAQIGVEVGRQALLKTANNFGFNKDFLFPDLKVSKSQLPLYKNLSNGELAWHAIGQGKTLVTPLHMAMVASSIANDGTMMEPKLLYKVIGRNGRVQKKVRPREYLKPLTPENAQLIKSGMIKAVQEGTAKGAAIKGVQVAGKTGTAEVKATKESSSTPHAWFIGFAPADKPSIAISVVIENGGTGGSKAAPLAGKVLRKAKELGY